MTRAASVIAQVRPKPRFWQLQAANPDLTRSEAAKLAQAERKAKESRK